MACPELQFGNLSQKSKEVASIQSLCITSDFNSVQGLKENAGYINSDCMTCPELQFGE